MCIASSGKAWWNTFLWRAVRVGGFVCVCGSLCFGYVLLFTCHHICSGPPPGQGSPSIKDCFARARAHVDDTSWARQYMSQSMCPHARNPTNKLPTEYYEPETPSVIFGFPALTRGRLSQWILAPNYGLTIVWLWLDYSLTMVWLWLIQRPVFPLWFDYGLIMV